MHTLGHLLFTAQHTQGYVPPMLFPASNCCAGRPITMKEVQNIPYWYPS